MDFFKLLYTEFAACLKPPGRDNRSEAVAHPGGGFGSRTSLLELKKQHDFVDIRSFVTLCYFYFSLHNQFVVNHLRQESPTFFSHGPNLLFRKFRGPKFSLR